MTGWTTDVSQGELIAGIVIQGAGLGLVFTPLQLVAFTTLAPSLLAHNAQGLHEVIGASVTPFNRALQALGPMAHWLLDPASRHGTAVLDQVINQQAETIAYVDDYVLMICATLPALLLLLVLMRRPPRAGVREPRDGAIMEQE